MIQGPEAVLEQFCTDPGTSSTCSPSWATPRTTCPGSRASARRAPSSSSRVRLRRGAARAPGEGDGKTREKLEAARDILLLSRELVTSTRPCRSIRPSRRSCRAGPTRRRLAALFRGWTSSRWSSASPPRAPARPSSATTSRCGTRPGSSQLGRARRVGRARARHRDHHPFPARDRQLVGLSFSAAEGRAFYVPFNAAPPVLAGGTQALLERLQPLAVRVGHPALRPEHKYDGWSSPTTACACPRPSSTPWWRASASPARSPPHLDALALHYFGLRKIPAAELTGTAASRSPWPRCPSTGGGVRLRGRGRHVARQGAPREELEAEGIEASSTAWRCRSCPCSWPWRSAASASTSARSPCSARTWRLSSLRVETFQELAGGPINVNSHKALGSCCSRSCASKTQAGVKQPEAHADRLVDRRRDAGSPVRRGEIVQKLLELPRGGEAQVDLRRLAAALRQPRDGPRALLLQPGIGRDRAPRVERPEPAEHPDPHGARPQAARGLRRARRTGAAMGAAVGRLQPGRAAHHGAPRRRREPDAGLPRGARHPRLDREPRSSTSCPAWSRARCAAAPR